jgi:hypothetical protein
MLKDRGYHTGATASYGGSGYFEPGWGMDQGFEEFDVHLKSLHSLAGDPSKTHGTSSRQLADLDIEWIVKHQHEKFFLWSHFYDTHFAFERHPDLPESDFGDAEIDLYDGEIRFTDFHIGRVLDTLRATGLWENTILVITSDHGDGFGDHGIPPNQRHGYHLYSNETKVPLIIRVPGLAPRRIATPVGHIDIVPTLLNLIRAHTDDEPTVQGQTRVGLITGTVSDDLPDQVFQEVTYEGPGSRYSGTQRRAVVTRDWHLIRNLVPDDTSELYDRSVDRAEERDVSGLGLSAENTLSTALGAWMDTLALPADFVRRVASNVQRRPFSPSQPHRDVVGDCLVLDGVDLPAGPAKAGQALDVVLYLHATQPIPSGWQLSTRVTTPGHTVNADHEPVDGLLPLSRLPPRRFVRDRFKIALPSSWPAEPTRIVIGLRRGTEHVTTGPNAVPEDAIQVAQFTVVR